MIKLSTRWFKRFLTPEVSRDTSGALQVALKDKDGVWAAAAITDNKLQKTHGVVSISDSHITDKRLRGLGIGKYMYKTLLNELKDEGKTKLFTSDITGTTSSQAASVWKKMGGEEFNGEIVQTVKTKQGPFIYRHKPQFALDLEKTGAYIPGVTETVGRVFTNLVEPFSYKGHFTKLKNILKKPKAAIGSIIKDKPAYTTASLENHGLWQAKDQVLDRDAILRYKFHLSERNPPATVTHDGKGTFNIKGNSWMRDDVVSNYIHGGPPQNALMGSYDLKANRQGIVYEDLWDLKTNRGENKWTPTNIARNFTDMVTKKAVIKGDFKPTGLSEKTLESAIRKAKDKRWQLQNREEWSKARKYDEKIPRLYLELQFKQKIQDDSIKRLGGEFIKKRVPDGEVGPKLTAYKNGLRKS